MENHTIIVFFYSALTAAILLLTGGIVTLFIWRRKRNESLVMISGALLGASVMALLFSLCLGFFMR